MADNDKRSISENDMRSSMRIKEQQNTTENKGETTMPETPNKSNPVLDALNSKAAASKATEGEVKVTSEFSAQTKTLDKTDWKTIDAEADPTYPVMRSNMASYAKQPISTGVDPDGTQFGIFRGFAKDGSQIEARRDLVAVTKLTPEGKAKKKDLERELAEKKSAALQEATSGAANTKFKLKEYMSKHSMFVAFTTPNEVAMEVKTPNQKDKTSPQTVSRNIKIVSRGPGTATHAMIVVPLDAYTALKEHQTNISGEALTEIITNATPKLETIFIDMKEMVSATLNLFDGIIPIMPTAFDAKASKFDNINEITNTKPSLGRTLALYTEFNKAKFARPDAKPPVKSETETDEEFISRKASFDAKRERFNQVRDIADPTATIDLLKLKRTDTPALITAKTHLPLKTFTQMPVGKMCTPEAAKLAIDTQLAKIAVSEAGVPLTPEANALVTYNNDGHLIACEIFPVGKNVTLPTTPAYFKTRVGDKMQKNPLPTEKVIKKDLVISESGKTLIKNVAHAIGELSYSEIQLNVIKENFRLNFAAMPEELRPAFPTAETIKAATARRTKGASKSAVSKFDINFENLDPKDISRLLTSTTAATSEFLKSLVGSEDKMKRIQDTSSEQVQKYQTPSTKKINIA